MGLMGWDYPDWVLEEERVRQRVKLMRELGIASGLGLVLGPEPRALSRVEVLEKKAAEEDTPRTRREARVEAAREDIRAKLGVWDLSAEQCDRMLDPAVFELE
jgi:hypothetical protein